MAILSHRCLDCGHPSWWHMSPSPTSACSRYCACTHRNVDPEPERLETWPVGRPSQLQPLDEPGTTWNARTSGQVRLCNCARCHAIYDEEMRRV